MGVRLRLAHENDQHRHIAVARSRQSFVSNPLSPWDAKSLYEKSYSRYAGDKDLMFLCQREIVQAGSECRRESGLNEYGGEQNQRR